VEVEVEVEVALEALYFLLLVCVSSEVELVVQDKVHFQSQECYQCQARLGQLNFQQWEHLSTLITT